MLLSLYSLQLHNFSRYIDYASTKKFWVLDTLLKKIAKLPRHCVLLICILFHMGGHSYEGKDIKQWKLRKLQ